MSRSGESFSEDICISLESGEEVRQRFLVFLMEHFRLPAAVWKKIDRTFLLQVIERNF